MTPEDHMAIEQLLYAYCDCVDRASLDELAELFTEDVILDYGFGRIFRGRAEIMTLLGNRLGSYLATSHHASNVVIGESAEGGVHVTSSIYAWHRLPDDSHAEVWGRYLDVVRRDSGRWHLACRTIRAAGWRGFSTPEGLPSPFEPIPRAGSELGGGHDV